MPYWLSLSVISLAIAAVEKMRPWRQQALRRHSMRCWCRPWARGMCPVDRFVGSSCWRFFALDLIQWGVHNLMHRVPWLCSIHRVHHSIKDMDCLGSMRFHCLEIVVYKSLQYMPLLLLGFHWQVLAWLVVFSTAMGHFNHANLNVPLGSLRNLPNYPTMHIWHHGVDLQGGYRCNFGINLSLWAWLFGSAYMPEYREQPDRIGFHGIARSPDGFLTQQDVPLTLWLGARGCRAH